MPAEDLSRSLSFSLLLQNIKNIIAIITHRFQWHQQPLLLHLAASAADKHTCDLEVALEISCNKHSTQQTYQIISIQSPKTKDQSIHHAF
jgi:hypothetical protein